MFGSVAVRGVHWYCSDGESTDRQRVHDHNEEELKEDGYDEILDRSPRRPADGGAEVQTSVCRETAELSEGMNQ